MVKKWSVSYPAVNGTEQRRVYVYLPTMYEAEPDRRYPVLYMFDGQNVFFDEDATFGKSWGVADYLDYTDTVFGQIYEGMDVVDTLAQSEAAVLANARHVTGRTSFDRSAVQKLAPQASYYPCNETLRPEFYTPPVWHPRTFGGAPVLLLSQGNYPLKNLHTVLKALPAVLAQYPGAVLRVAGWPPLDKGPLLRPVIDWMFPYQTWCKQLIRRLGLADHVQYTGPLDAAAMRQAYLDADLFLLPSYSENSPNSLGEAMLLGLPCVASAAGGLPDMLQSGVQGMLYGAAGDDAALSAAILQVLALPDHGTALGTAAQIRARVTHDAAKNTAQMIEIYRKVLQREGTL